MISIYHQAVMISSGAAAAAFSPSDVTGLHAWYDARFGVEVSSGVPAVNNDTVEFWRDHSGNGRDMSQATGANRVTYKTADINSQPACYAASPFYTLPTSTASASLKPFTIFSVINPILTASGAIFGSSGAGGIEFRTNPNGTMELLGQGAVSIATSSGTVSANTTAIVAITYSGVGAYKFWKNNASAGTGTNDQTIASSNTGTLFTGAGENFDGYIASVVVYDNVISDGNMSSLFGYYNTLYAAY